MQFLKRLKMNYLIGALVMIAVGVVLIVWTGDSIRFFARLLAALLVLVGVVAVVAYFRNDEKSYLASGALVIGILIAAVGIWILINPDYFTDLIPKLFGVFIILSGIVNLGQTISLAKSNYDYWSVSLVFAVITIGMGVVLLVEPTFIKEFLVTLIGIFLVYDGVSNLWTIVKVAKFVKDKVQEETAIDTEAVVVGENTSMGNEQSEIVVEDKRDNAI